MEKPKSKNQQIEIQTKILQPVDQVWDMYTRPEHITKWHFASDNWCCPRAEIDLKAGGRFSVRMEAKEGGMGFDFEGRYNDLVNNKFLTYTLDDSRTARVLFETVGNFTGLKISFDPEKEIPRDTQRDGWQSILNNFREYAESQG